MLLYHSGKPNTWDNHLIFLINELVSEIFLSTRNSALFLPASLHQLIGESVNFRTLKINNSIVLIGLGLANREIERNCSFLVR